MGQGYNVRSEIRRADVYYSAFLVVANANVAIILGQHVDAAEKDPHG